MPFFFPFHCKVWSRFPLVQIHDFRHASAIFQISNVSNIAKKTEERYATVSQKTGAKTPIGSISIQLLLVKKLKNLRVKVGGIRVRL